MKVFLSSDFSRSDMKVQMFFSTRNSPTQSVSVEITEIRSP